MMDTDTPRPRRRRQFLRRFTLLLVALGVGSEMVVIAGMIFGILAGVAFMITSEATSPALYWAFGMVFCLLRILCLRLDENLQAFSSRDSLDEVFFSELPERVSDAVTLIGFGFAVDSDPWLGLAAALSAIFSAYTRSVAFSRGVGRRSATSGPMTRTHRLILLSATSLLMILGVSNEHLTTPIPHIALWLILFGCVATILIRWLNIPGRKA